MIKNTAPLIESRLPDPDFWNGKKVFLTGHTGFKGSWATLWLKHMGAQITAYSLEPQTNPSLFAHLSLDNDINSIIGDICDVASLDKAMKEAQPDIIIHMAAQPLVRYSYEQPIETLTTNIMGSAYLLNILRTLPKVQAALMITTDKVYENDEKGAAFKESDKLGGHDPYSASKAAMEITVQSFARSYFDALNIPIATARGGNVIGGGDFSADRLVPDIYRALKANAPLTLRNPHATRPWQHVLDCLCGYFIYCEDLCLHKTQDKTLNFGPSKAAKPLSVQRLAGMLSEALEYPKSWQQDTHHQPHEMQALQLDTTQATKSLGWHNRLSTEQTLIWTAQWYKAFSENPEKAEEITLKQVEHYCR